MFKILVVLLSLQLVACVPMATVKGESLSADTYVVTFKNDKVFGQSPLSIFEAEYSGGEHDGKTGLQFTHGEDVLTIMPNNLKSLQLDLKTARQQHKPSAMVLIPSMEDIQKGYSLEIFFAGKKRIISLKNGGTYLTLDDANVKKIISLIGTVIEKNETAPSGAVVSR